VPDTTAPGPVTALTATKSGTTVTLSWKNPTDADFTGAVIRRGLGNTVLATVTAGTAVTDTDKAATSFTDTGLTKLTRYTYAVFAHDAVPNYARGISLGVTTNRVPVLATVAGLSVTPLGMFPNDINAVGLINNNKLTVNTPSFFDGGASAPRDGTTLVSGTLTYGDGETFAFPEPAGPVNFYSTIHTYTTTGDKTVALSVTDSTGTTATTTFTVTVFDPATASVSVPAATVGTPVTVNLPTTTPAGTVFRSYYLEFGPVIVPLGPPPPDPPVPAVETFHFPSNPSANVDIAPPATLDVTFTKAGNYHAKFIVVNDAGSAPAATVDFVVN
jgi:hypothetical protein